jgi:hypothetical protein
MESMCCFRRRLMSGVLLLPGALLVLVCAAGCGKPSNGTAVDLGGSAVDPFASDARATVLMFVAVDCPISNRLMPQIRRIHEQFTNANVKFWMVYPDPSTDSDLARKHLREYECEIPALHDRNHTLTKLARARVTPEAAVFDAQRRLVYHGRINNQFVDLGKARPDATEHDLMNALNALLAGKPITNSVTKAIGCHIPSLR